MFKYINETIETDRLMLRRFTMADAPRVAEICNDYDLYQKTLALPYPYTIECAEGWISTHDENFANDRSLDFAITDKESGELYGCIGIILNMKDKNGELGYWMDKEYRNNGYATEAASAIIEFAFRIKGLHRVHARHFGTNPASGRVMQKCGMTYEGKQPDHIFKTDHFEDILLYGLVNKESSV